MTTASIRDEFHRQGYIVIHQVLPTTLLESLRGIAENIFKNQTSQEREDYRSLGSLTKVWGYPDFVDLITHESIREIFSQLDSVVPRFSNGYVLSKPPGSPRTFWHQDWWLWDEAISYEISPPQIGVLVYLSETTREKACLRVIPTSHRKRHRLHDLLPSYPKTSLRRAEDLSVPPFATFPEEVDVCTQEGDIVILDARTLHAAHANSSDSLRTGVTSWYYPHFESFPRRIQSRLPGGAIPAHWPESMRLKIEPWMVPQTTLENPLVFCEHPDQRLAK